MKTYIKKPIFAIILTILASTIILGCGRSSEAPEDLMEIPSPTPVFEEEIVIIEKHDISITEPEQEIKDEFDLPDINPHDLQIVFLGETNLDVHRDRTGIAYLVGEFCDATIYNLAIGGTTAALYGEEDNEESDKMNLRSLVGISNILAGKENASAIDHTRARDVIEGLDVSKTDYFVIMYGSQDFVKGIPLDTPEFHGGRRTYVGAFREAIANLREVAPHADIVICAPHYSQFFDKENTYIGDGNILSNGHSFLYDYAKKIGYLAGEQRVIHADAYLSFGIDGYTAADYLDDGVHLSEKGRRKFAEVLSDIILDHEMNYYN